MDAPLDLLVEENVRRQVGNVVRSEVMRGAWEAGKEGECLFLCLGGSAPCQVADWHSFSFLLSWCAVTVHGWVYKLHDGKIKDLHVSYGLKEFKEAQAKEAKK